VDDAYNSRISSTINNIKYIQHKGSLTPKQNLQQSTIEVYKEFAELMLIKKSLNSLKFTMTNQKFKEYVSEMVGKI